ncbi:MAG: class I SAM-dependent methyltransferase [Anaerolineales bacterium]
MNRFAGVWQLGGLAISLIIFILGIIRDVTLATTLGFFGIILFAFLLALIVTTSVAPRQSRSIESVEFLYNLSQTRSSDNLATIDLGRRWPAITLSHHLTSGRMVVVNIYNPQLMPARSLMRSQQHHYPVIPSDPRLFWYDSNLDLLPLPDRSVSAVFLYFVLSEIAEKGDQITLLNEITRTLEPGGRLLIAEFANTILNRLRSSLGLLQVRPYEYWGDLLEDTGYKFQRSQTMKGNIIYIRADKLPPYVGSQMSLDLDFETY